MWKYSEYVLKIYFDEFLDTNRFVTNGIQFKNPNNKFLVCFALIILVDVKSIPLAGISTDSESDLEKEFSFTLYGHATLLNAERIFSCNGNVP